jgi:hypothetical protein
MKILFVVESKIIASFAKSAIVIRAKIPKVIGLLFIGENFVKTVNTFFKVPTPRDKKYLDFIKWKPCCVCRAATPSDPHHIPEEGRGGKGLKCSDYRAIPLCHSHHLEYHNGGKQTFAAKYELDYEELISAYNKWWRERV